jgi:hypothetical protein
VTAIRSKFAARWKFVPLKDGGVAADATTTGHHCDRVPVHANAGQDLAASGFTVLASARGVAVIVGPDKIKAMCVSVR